ncbi:DUF2946 family protein [Rhizorhabdus phycosphaerae]|uniref:DUF2946 family protein n=1 Tax=Rhizorhabdus phycosphaerae TaxID=2711156 RepID=UPI0013EDA163|nr:DUF2946 family protein [Rhizorhabdus phycosphaerae]
MGRVRHLWTRIVPLMLIGLMFGALAPQGFMPRVGENGLSIILCSGSGPATASIDPSDPLYAKMAAIAGSADRHDDDDPRAATLPHCAFAGSAMAALLPAPPIVSAQLDATPIAPAMVATIARNRYRAARPPATGPPVLV